MERKINRDKETRREMKRNIERGGETWRERVREREKDEERQREIGNGGKDGERSRDAERPERKS